MPNPRGVQSSTSLLDAIKQFALLVLGLLLLATGHSFAQQSGPPIAFATRANHEPKLDGSLDDPVWLTAKPITDFRQREPNEGQPATERTEVRILYTQREVFFGIACFESDPSHLMATELRRDVNQGFDDHFTIVIDSRHDRRNAYAFQINPLGTQRDGLIIEESGGGEDYDAAWDGVWISVARRTELGWTATVAIPFSTLNITSSANPIWGLQLQTLYTLEE